MRSADSFPSLKLHDDTSFEFFWAWGNLSMQWGAAQATPHFIASMSFRLVIPRRVALQQGPPPLRLPVSSMLRFGPAGRQIFSERLTVS